MTYSFVFGQWKKHESVAVLYKLTSEKLESKRNKAIKY